MPEKDAGKKGSSGGDKPFDGKVDEYVGRVVPAHLLATVFACTAAGALLLFILMIIGFARSPEKAAQESVDAARKALTDQRDRQAKTTLQLQAALAATAEAEGKAKRADDLAKRAESKGQGSDDKCKQLEEQKAELQKKLRAEESGRRKAESDKAKSASERDAALRAKKTVEQHAAKLDGDIKGLRDELQKLQAAKETFDSIMQKVAGAEEPEKRVELIESLRAEHKAELAGTTYMARLDAELEREKRNIQEGERSAAKEAKLAAKDVYEEAMRQLAMVETHEKAIEILSEAKAELTGTAYEVNVHKEMVKREAAHEKKAAREIYDEVLKQVNASPKDYEENLRALEDALVKGEGTTYAAKLEKTVEKKKKTLKGDVAGAAWNDLLAQIKAKPDEYDENIAAAEDALLKAEGTKLEGKVRKKLEGLKKDRLQKIGQEAYEEARAQLAKSRKDHATNVVVLRELEEKAAGSPRAPAIAKMRAREEKLRDRGR